jgi:hypothetical protein
MHIESAAWLPKFESAHAPTSLESVLECIPSAISSAAFVHAFMAEPLLVLVLVLVLVDVDVLVLPLDVACVPVPVPPVPPVLLLDPHARRIAGGARKAASLIKLCRLRCMGRVLSTCR